MAPLIQVTTMRLALNEQSSAARACKLYTKGMATRRNDVCVAKAGSCAARAWRYAARAWRCAARASPAKYAARAWRCAARASPAKAH